MKEQNIASVRRFWQAFDNHDLDVWDEVCTDDFVNYDPGLPVPDHAKTSYWREDV